MLLSAAPTEWDQSPCPALRRAARTGWAVAPDTGQAACAGCPETTPGEREHGVGSGQVTLGTSDGGPQAGPPRSAAQLGAGAGSHTASLLRAARAPVTNSRI